MGLEQFITQLVGHGPVGLLAAVCLYIAYKKDKEVKDLYALMLEREEKRAARDQEFFVELNETVRSLMGDNNAE